MWIIQINSGQDSAVTDNTSEESGDQKHSCTQLSMNAGLQLQLNDAKDVLHTILIPIIKMDMCTICHVGNRNLFSKSVMYGYSSYT